MDGEPMGAAASEEQRDMPDGPEGKRPIALTCPTCGGAVRQTTEGGLPRFACHLGHRFAPAEMDEAQFHEMQRVLETALRLFNERAELARRLAEVHGKQGRPVSAEYWEATAREMNEAAAALRRFMERGWRHPGAETGGGHKPDAVQG
jgi:two-component system, chemotaxis family, protein-glutamate methylesterase/glutaminase